MLYACVSHSGVEEPSLQLSLDQMTHRYLSWNWSLKNSLQNQQASLPLNEFLSVIFIDLTFIKSKNCLIQKRSCCVFVSTTDVSEDIDS